MILIFLLLLEIFVVNIFFNPSWTNPADIGGLNNVGITLFAKKLRLRCLIGSSYASD